MNKQLSIFVIFLLLFSAFGSANDEVADGRAMIRAEREETVRTELHMTSDESAKFWPIYSTYRDSHDEIMGRYGAVIADYLRRYDDADLSDEYADELIETYFGIQRELLDVKEEFLPRFREVLSPLKVARFYQLENKMNADIDAGLALVIPLIEAD
jgi:hypothetical protein